MNHCAKRSRQMTLFECFNQTENIVGDKKSESGKMNSVTEESETPKAEMRELLASAAEKRMGVEVEATSRVEEDGTGELMESGGISSLLNNFDDLLTNTNASGDLPWVNSASSTEQNDVALNRWPECGATLPPLKPSDEHTIMFRPHLLEGCAPRPFPDEYRDKWDGDHVRMPCSPLNRYPVESLSGEKTLESRWGIICNALSMRMESSVDLQNAIMQYNRQYVGRWNFNGLHSFFNKHLDIDQRVIFFQFTLPGMVHLAVQLPEICTKPIPLLKKHMSHAVTFSQKQIGCLLANAFFCTFPRRNHVSRYHSALKSGEYVTYPDINFNRLFSGTKSGISQRNCEKLKCLLNYFSRIVNTEPTGTVTFHRQHLQMYPNFSASAKNINKVVVLCKGLIETGGHGMLQVDFANKFVGGGVLGHGCIQEEIRFVISPELILSRLFTECLGDTEALIVTGVEQYSKYKGYGDTFRFDGDFRDKTPRDAWGRKYTRVVAIDALYFNKSDDQFKLSLIKRELNKAYTGFFEGDLFPENLPAVATGNWGCGAFHGSPHLKFLIQLMAASQADRAMVYFTFEEQKLQEELKEMYEFLVAKKLTVGDLWTLLDAYCSSIMNVHEELWPKLFEYIYRCHSKCDTSTSS